MPVRELAGATDGPTHAQGQFCVIGAGMAGLFLARRLALSGYRVIVVESGGGAADQDAQELNDIIDINGHYTRARNGRYRGLGGSSARWGGRTIPVYRHDIEKRAYLEQAAWPVSFDELEAHGAEIEKAFSLPLGSYGAEAQRDAQVVAAFPVGEGDFACRWAKWIDFGRCNLGSLWKRALERQPNLDIWLGATVVDFTVDASAGRLTAIKARSFDGKQLEVTADHFVVAAGTIETTRLLLWLKACSNDHAFAGCEVLGQYFQDHLKAGVATISRRDPQLSNRLFGYHFIGGTRRSLHLDLTPAAQEADRVSSAFVYAAMDLSGSHMARLKTLLRGVQSGQTRVRDMLGLVGDSRLVLQSLWWRYVNRQVYMPPDVGLDVQIAIEQAPDAGNRITLSAERDRLGLPRAVLDWRPTAHDARTFEAVIARLKRYWSLADLDRSCPLDWRVDGDGQAVCAIAEAYAHPSGSARMGVDRRTSVVGPDLACHGIPNVSVASAATFPTAGSANPTLTILKLALRLADSLATGKAGARNRGLPEQVQAISATLQAAMAPANPSATRRTSSSSI